MTLYDKVSFKIFEIQKYIIDKYGIAINEAGLITYPLSWYVHSGRSSADFDRAVISAKTFILSRVLYKCKMDGSTVDETVKAIKTKLGF